jgi:hypothetical protein
MRSLILAVFSVAALLCVSSDALAQGVQPIPQLTPQPNTRPTPQLSIQPTPQPNTQTPQPNTQLTPLPNTQPTPSPPPGAAASSEATKPSEYRAYPEPGRYHPCPASVGFPDGRTVCLGLDDVRRRPHSRHVARRVANWGCGCCCWHYW